MYSVRQKASVTLANRNVGSGKNREKWMLERYPINYTSIKNLLNKFKKKKKGNLAGETARQEAQCNQSIMNIPTEDPPSEAGSAYLPESASVSAWS